MTTIPNTFIRRLALTVGILLSINGIWGLLLPPAFFFFDANLLQAMLALVGGAVGVRASRRRRSARGYCMVSGITMLSIGGLGIAPGFGPLMFLVMEVNPVHAVALVFLGGAALLASVVIPVLPAVIRLRTYDTGSYGVVVGPSRSSSMSSRLGHASPL